MIEPLLRAVVDEMEIAPEEWSSWRCYKDLEMERIAIRWLEANSIQWIRNEPDGADAPDDAPF